MVIRKRITINGRRICRHFKSIELANEWKQFVTQEMSEDSLSGESWKTIPGFSNYEASNLGRIRSLNYNGSEVIRVMKAPIGPLGYRKIRLRSDKKIDFTRDVHWFVALAYLGERPSKGLHVNHIDGDKLNNKPENLEYVTPIENIRHAWANGLCSGSKGEKNGSSRLTKEQVRIIRKAKSSGKRFWGGSSFAKEFGVSITTISKVACREDYWSEA